MTREEAHKLVDQLFDGGGPDDSVSPGHQITGHDNTKIDVVSEATKRVLPEGKRVVRTKTSGDRVYLIDEVKKTRQWVTNPEVLKSLGFEIGDVVELDDNDILSYQMGPAIYRVDA